jgi:NADH:ubiquinone oxidoreductase subunit 6 (subunit J)
MNFAGLEVPEAMKAAGKEHRMTTLETVAVDQSRWSATALELKNSNWARFRLMAVLSLGGAILEALAVQIHTSYPGASQVAGYAGAVALVLVLIMRAKWLRRERSEAWVLAAAASQSLKREMYRYRTSSGPYADRLGGNPEATLLQRRDAIFEKTRSIQKYIIESDSKPVAPLGSLDADAYIAERINAEINRFRMFSKDLPKIQATWLRLEYFLAGAAVLLAAVLAFTHNQAYSAWVIVITFLSLAPGASTKSERYATLTVEYRTMPDRLASILDQWRAHHGTLEQLVEQVEATMLAEGEAWVAGVDEFQEDTASLPAKGPAPEMALHSPASRAGA